MEEVLESSRVAALSMEGVDHTCGGSLSTEVGLVPETASRMSAEEGWSPA